MTNLSFYSKDPSNKRFAITTDATVHYMKSTPKGKGDAQSMYPPKIVGNPFDAAQRYVRTGIMTV